MAMGFAFFIGRLTNSRCIQSRFPTPNSPAGIDTSLEHPRKITDIPIVLKLPSHPLEVGGVAYWPTCP
jgi:hypothetical protein